MCAIVDGYKLFQVTDGNGNLHKIAGITHEEVRSRAAKRGIQSVTHIKWDNRYGEYAGSTQQHVRQKLYNDLVEDIFKDVSEN